MPGLARIEQDDFSAGMFPSATPERIPVNGVYSASNALVDDTGGLYKRGGVTAFAAATWPSTQILWVWQGVLTGGSRTLFATASNLYSIGGGTITTLGAYTGMAGGASRPIVLNGVMYLPNGASAAKTYDGTTYGTAGFADLYFTSVANRIVEAGGDQIFFSGVGTTAFAATDFWRIPGGVAITGLATLRDSAVVFTTQGTWVISNMALNLTDAAGNVQQRLDLYSPDLALWGSGSAGVVGYQGGLVVPARDGVWLMRLGTTSEVQQPLQLLSEPISAKYKSYIAAGYLPGQAAVYNGHYFLPIVGSGVIQNLLVCRLDTKHRPWTQFDGTGSAYAVTASQDGKSLIGAMATSAFGVGQSLLATLNYFDPTVTVDPGSTSPTWSVISRDMMTGDLGQNTITKLRVAYRLTDPGGGNPIIVAEIGTTGTEGTISSALTGSAPKTDGELRTYSWPVIKRARTARFKFLNSDQSTRLTLQSVEMFVRSAGRQ